MILKIHLIKINVLNTKKKKKSINQYFLNYGSWNRGMLRTDIIFERLQLLEPFEK